MVYEITVNPRPASTLSTAVVETCHPLLSYVARVVPGVDRLNASGGLVPDGPSNLMCFGVGHVRWATQ
jgi:hypothetical protein